MKFAFRKMRLEAESFYAIISAWAEMQLLITDEQAAISGFGFSEDIAEAFSTLVLDWEATIFLPRDEIALPPGAYSLIRLGDEAFACRGQQKFLLEDHAVTVEVLSLP